MRKGLLILVLLLFGMNVGAASSYWKIVIVNFGDATERNYGFGGHIYGENI